MLRLLDRIQPVLILFLNKWWHTLGCAIFICILSLLPQHALPPASFSFEDLLVHFVMYSGLSACIALSLFQKLSRFGMTDFVYIILGISCFGFVLEILQGILPIQRYFAWSDAFANLLGASTFYFFGHLFKR